MPAHELAHSTAALESEDEWEEKEEMGSVNHSLAQTKLTTMLSNDKRFSTLVELSLEVGEMDLTQFGIKNKRELKPDLCLYLKGIKPKERDVIRMSDMPLLAIEIISPEQGINELLGKFEAYFALGVKSCWLVIPMPWTITVYSALDQFRTFDPQDDEVFDEVADIRLSMKEILDW